MNRDYFSVVHFNRDSNCAKPLTADDYRRKTPNYSLSLSFDEITKLFETTQVPVLETSYISIKRQ